MAVAENGESRRSAVEPRLPGHEQPLFGEEQRGVHIGTATGERDAGVGDEMRKIPERGDGVESTRANVDGVARRAERALPGEAHARAVERHLDGEGAVAAEGGHAIGAHGKIADDERVGATGVLEHQRAVGHDEAVDRDGRRPWSGAAERDELQGRPRRHHQAR